ncbi:MULTISPECIES: transposase [Exiguobacterium]|uniref:transposase n=1 Tax=Exiguobacterium TaxID=33986 RepID=UPI001BEA33D4|nr:MULTISPECIES: transposase [Exiguobacterium]MCT4782315.1 transposase [Exiguobacterium himgiriensis]
MYGTKWGEMVEDWLTEDQMLQKKLRRTIKKIYETLVANGFEGSYRTVCNFIKSWHMTSEEENDTRHERLQHLPGEAQVDFGTMEVVKDSHAVDVKCLVMSLPFSNRTAAVAHVFPDAKHVLDRFHLIQFFTDALRRRRRFLNETSPSCPCD